MSREALIAGAGACAMVLQARGLTSHPGAARALVDYGLAVTEEIAEAVVQKAMNAVALPVRERVEQAAGLPHGATEAVLQATIACGQNTGPVTSEITDLLVDIGHIIGLNAQRYLV